MTFSIALNVTLQADGTYKAEAAVGADSYIAEGATEKAAIGNALKTMAALRY